MGFEQRGIDAVGAEGFQVVQGTAAQGLGGVLEWGMESAEEGCGGEHSICLYTDAMLTVTSLFAMLAFMRAETKHPLGLPPAAYKKLLARLAQPGWFCQGTVVCRPLRRKIHGQWVEKGPYYLWTGKRDGKTVCHALSQAQYEVAKEAIETNRQVMETLAKLQSITLQTILKQVPGVQRRK